MYCSVDGKKRPQRRQKLASMDEAAAGSSMNAAPRVGRWCRGQKWDGGGDVAKRAGCQLGDEWSMCHRHAGRAREEAAGALYTFRNITLVYANLVSNASV